MKDRVAGAPGQYSATVTGAELNKMQNGEPFAITLKRDDKPEVEGTPYSKAAVLPDDVAQEICPDIEDPTPADAFRGLAKKKVTVADYIIEQGSNEIWTWRKWASGAAEIWGTVGTNIPRGEYYPLPIIIWGNKPNWHYPVVNCSVIHDTCRLSVIEHSGSEFDCGFEWDEETDTQTEVITETLWYIPFVSFYEVEEDGALTYVDTDNYRLDVHMIGRWKPLDGEDASKEILAVNIGGVEIDDEDTSAYKTWSSLKIDGIVGDISSALDELHDYAQGLINGGEA